MKKIIISVLLIFTLFSCSLEKTESNKNESNNYSNLNEKIEDNEIRLRCVKKDDIDIVIKEVRKINKDKKRIKLLMIDNGLCSGKIYDYNFDKIEDSVFWLKLDRLMFLVWWEYLKNIKNIFKKTKINYVTIWICRKEWDKSIIREHCLWD